MTLELSSEEFRSLLHLVNLGLYMTDPCDDSEAADELAGMFELADQLLAHAVEEGHDDMLKFDPTVGEFVPTEEYATDSVYSRVMRCFEEDFFWGELAAMLAERDVRRRHPNMPQEAQDTIAQDIEENYMEHFAQHGLERVHIIPPSPHQ
jgi:hypothetical protein